MAVRKNAKFLTAAEKEAFVRACVGMKADIVNPTAPESQRYSRWDENVALHWMIQNAFAPGASPVNFGHGGSGSYSFLSWHRYFLFQFERQLQGYVPGVTIPYWDWTDPAPVMTDTFLGPNGVATTGEVLRGYFAADAPGTGSNPVAAPSWWPAGLTGWRLPQAFGAGAGALRRRLRAVTGLPTASDLRATLAQSTYPGFQNTLESGLGLASGNEMHNGMHVWIGGGIGQMGSPAYSPFDPFFYLHHCNIDRLWAMWQMDGHAGEYPETGGKVYHRRLDPMYPWVGTLSGFGTNAAIASAIPMPDFSAVGVKRNVDTLDFRSAFGYTYDTLAVVGIGLDRTGSMNALTPDPMVTSAPDVSKWEAARRGVSAFLQDCETVQNSGLTYVTAGVETFRQLGSGNDFAQVFPAPGYGLVKSGTPFSRAGFESAAAGMSADGGTPLGEALLDVHQRLVDPPFGRLPADERRYLAMLTDGLSTAGAPLSSIGDDSLGETAVFAMGFGTGFDVDYATLAEMVGKGRTLPTAQVFHGENAGTIDKFYSNALARAIGFTSIIDPVLELFAGEHAHVEFLATSADDSFLITVQGMDFDDESWSVALHAPDGAMAYTDGPIEMGHHGHECDVDVTVSRGAGRTTLLVQRDNAHHSCWVGNWRLMVAYRARWLDGMVMPDIGGLIVPVSAGPIRGQRYRRLLSEPIARIATRNVKARPANRLDVVPLSTNRQQQPACNAVVNIYGRTRLRTELRPESDKPVRKSPLTMALETSALQGNVTISRSFARMITSKEDLRATLADLPRRDIPKEALLKGSTSLKFDPALLLAILEKRNRKLARVRDEELELVPEEEDRLLVRVEDADTEGTYHLGVYVEGWYCPDHDSSNGHDGGHEHGEEATDEGHAQEESGATGHTCDDSCELEPFARILTTSAAVTRRRGR